MTLHKRFRDTLTRYLQPTPLDADRMPETLLQCFSKGLIDRVSNDSQGRPVYLTNAKGREALSNDRLPPVARNALDKYYEKKE